MKPKTSNLANPPSLDQLLQRGDIWRGQSQHLLSYAAWDTGYKELNDKLLNQGWPIACLVEICQTGGKTESGYPGSHTNATSQGEWLLLAPAIRQIKEGYTVLLNPPAVPFAAGLIQAGINLDRLLVVEAETKMDFLASFVELARAEICVAVLAWQPKQSLSYTELRKCQLACSNGRGLYFLFRPISARQQSSPAAVRLCTWLHFQSLEVQIFKQKGSLSRVDEESIHLPLPVQWQPAVCHADLDLSHEKAADVTPPLKRNQS